MDKRSHNNHSIPLSFESGETHANLYYLHVKQEGSVESEAIPLQLLVNEQDAEHERYLISVVQGKELHLLIDPHDQPGIGTDYRISTPDIPANSESTNSVQILSNISFYPNTCNESMQRQSVSTPENFVQKQPVSICDNIESKENVTKIFKNNTRKVPQKFDPRVQPGIGTDYRISTPDIPANSESTNSVQILSNISFYPNTCNESMQRQSVSTPENSVQKQHVSICDNIESKENVTKIFKNNTRKVPQKFVHISDRVVPPRAVAVLPGALQLRRGVVSPRRPLPARVRFGPVEGINCMLSMYEVESLVQESTNSRTPFFLVKTEDGVTQIDVSDKDKSNWLSILPLGTQDTANLWLRQEGDRLYAVTTRPIAARTPLSLGYSKEYGDTYRIAEPVMNVEAELSRQCKWWCHECQRVLPAPALLQRHMDLHHVEEKQRSKQRYRCKQCTRTFCRLFTLKRHVARHCTSTETGGKPKTTTEPTGANLKHEELPDLSLNTSNADDSRLPSDDSLQTLTNNLDFSTNLFDTDRMPNLDISGSSRSDTDFNYSLLKEDMLPNSIEFPIETDCNVKKEFVPDTTTNVPETVFLTCRHCDQSVVKGKQRQHVRVCSGRKFRCDCGCTFPYKDKLALHIHLDHADDTAKEKEVMQGSDSQQYRCETCKLNFKRRGMLVNHLWRVHGQLACSVPLEKKQLVFPCAVCPKIYATAAKRTRHTRQHHPGCELNAPALERGRRACEPAACPACPRQYATRAKLLQHVRSTHQLLAPPVKKKISIKKVIK